ncbi:putative beta-lysine N-acetyltransferase [bacterium]|nr:putative beta-lysine N-acetyltransferase [bacterium]
MNFDVIETIGRSRVQHGKRNNRAYLMKLHPSDYSTMPEQLERLAREQGYTKIFTKIPVAARDYFKRKQYVREAMIPEYYRNGDKALFFSKFLDDDRSTPAGRERELIRKNLKLAEEKADEDPPAELPAGYTMRPLGDRDAPALAGLYRDVFPSYPFPIHDPDYLIRTMESHIYYFGVFRGADLIAAASSETDPANGSVEMTDFATLPAERGHGLASHLLTLMEEEILRKGITCHYTIARAFSAGMNITFAKAGYAFSGTLVNNTDIFGRIESMNVWHKTFS